MTDSIELRAIGPRALVPVPEAREISEHFLAILTVARETMAVAGTPAAPIILDLSGRVWEFESVIQLDRVFLTIHPNVTTLKFDDITALLSTAEGLGTYFFLQEALAKVPRLTTLNFDDNAVGTRGIDILHPFLTNKALRHLTLENVGLAEDDAAALHRFLGVYGPGQGQLQPLMLGRNQMGPDGARYIGASLAELPHLEKFS